MLNRFVKTKLAGDCPRSGRQKKLTPLEERFTGDISDSNSALYNIYELFLVRDGPQDSPRKGRWFIAD